MFDAGVEKSVVPVTPALSGVEVFEPIRRLLTEARTVLSIAHPFLDGDALGSQLAMASFCRTMGKQWVGMNFDPLPDSLMWVPGVDALVAALPPEQPLFDLMFLMETTDASRMGDRVAFFDRARHKVHLDHHVDVKGLGHYNYIDSRASSTCEILYDVLEPWKDRLEKDFFEAIYLGIMTDTGNFRFSNSTPRSHAIAAEVIERGVDISRLFKKTYEANPARRIIIHGLAMGRLQRQYQDKILHTWLTREDFQKAGASVVDADGAVNHLCTVTGAEVVVIFREQADGRIKVSMRSTGKADVQVLSRKFGGGGHRMAAGAEVPGTLADVSAKVLAEIEAFLQHHGI